MKSPVIAGLAALSAIALAGCSYVNPITTQENYAASDGTQLVAGDVQAYNLIVIAEDEGAPGTLLGTLVNSGDEDVELAVSFDAATSTTVTVPAGESITLSPLDGDETVTGTAPVKPGLMTEVGMESSTAGFYSALAPVLDGTLPEYAPVLDAIG